MALKNKIKRLRRYRRYHRILGISLAVLLLISATTGILLALKKNVALIQPPTQKGISKQLDNWKPVAELASLAQKAFYTQFPEQEGNPIDRIDVRPAKGIAKVLFEKGWWEVQIDGTSGKILSIAKRHSDWIEALHDGSIISDSFKLVSMNFIGWGVLIMIFTGLWLWYGPKRIRQLKKKNKPQPN